jgi:hypothetical protein
MNGSNARRTSRRGTPTVGMARRWMYISCLASHSVACSSASRIGALDQWWCFGSRGPRPAIARRCRSSICTRGDAHHRSAAPDSRRVASTSRSGDAEEHEHTSQHAIPRTPRRRDRRREADASRQRAHPSVACTPSHHVQAFATASPCCACTSA